MRLPRLSFLPSFLPSFRPPRLLRTPFAFWLCVAALASVTGLVVANLVGRASALAARYGPLAPVVVAARAVERGAALEAGDLAIRQLPGGFRPEGVLSAVADAEGRTAVVPLLAGQTVLQGHLAPEGLGGLAVLLPPGLRAVAVPTGSASAPVRGGDGVDVLATFDAEVAPGGDPTVVVAAEAVVLDAGPESATVAVTPEEAKAVAFALTHGSLTLALTPATSATAGLRGPNAAAGLRGPNAAAASGPPSRSGSAPPPPPPAGTPRRE